MRQNYDIERRHELRDGSGLMWPERAMPQTAEENTAEIEAALSRRRRATPAPVPPPPSRRKPGPWHRGDGQPRQPVVIPSELTHNGRKLTYAEAGALRGISAAAMFKRVRKFGFAAAMTMGK
jgi:hypothetical protein